MERECLIFLINYLFNNTGRSALLIFSQVLETLLKSHLTLKQILYHRL